MGGSADLIAVCRHVWRNHEDELWDSGDLFYTWQYDIRWAATDLRGLGVMRSKDDSPRGIWELAASPGRPAQDLGEASGQESISVEPADSVRQERAWIFQANPRLWDLEGSLAALRELSWVVRRHRKDIHAGDRVYLWEAGSRAGVVAVGTVITEPAVGLQLPEQEPFRLVEGEFDKAEHRVTLRIHHVLAPRLEKVKLLDHSVLRDLSVIRAPTGTNFAVAESERIALDQMIASAGDSPDESS